MRIAYAVSLLIILTAFAASVYLYPQMPDKIAAHWNINGDADGYMDKTTALSIMPLIAVGMLALFVVVPRIDPKKRNIGKFRAYFDGFVVLLLGFLLYVHALVIAWNLGINFSMAQMLAPAVGVLFYYVGVLTSHSKRNYSIGIRTPWTLSNEKVWDKTHLVGGMLFRVAGVIAIFGAALPQHAFFMVLAPIITASIAVYAYSYFVYRKMTRKG
ncbi:MAG TPA: SdpI family protein [archaeon]|nr:SdpI family protein [archaeon]